MGISLKIESHAPKELSCHINVEQMCQIYVPCFSTISILFISRQSGSPLCSWDNLGLHSLLLVFVCLFTLFFIFQEYIIVLVWMTMTVPYCIGFLHQQESATVFYVPSLLSLPPTPSHPSRCLETGLKSLSHWQIPVFRHILISCVSLTLLLLPLDSSPNSQRVHPRIHVCLKSPCT